MRMTLGERIKQAREERGWSGTELARRAGLPQPTIQRVETKPNAEPGVITVLKVAKALGLTVEQLVGDVPITPRLTTKAAKTDDRVQKLESQVATLMKQIESRGSPQKPPASKKKRP